MSARDAPSPPGTRTPDVAPDGRPGAAGAGGPQTPPAGPVLAEALRYVARWRGRTVVVKMGGRALSSGAGRGTVRDLALLHRSGVRLVAVHGGGAGVTRLAERLGREPRFVDGLRVTDEPTMELAEMVLAGRVNKRLSGRLQGAGAPAVGIAGLDGGLLRAAPHPDAGTLGRVGEVEDVDPTLLRGLLDEGFLPVVAPVSGDAEGRSWNVNADTAAASLAGALGAEKLVVVTDVEGVYPADGSGDGPIPELDPDRTRELIARGAASEGMVPKLEACLSALERGVGSAHVVGGDAAHPVLVELLTDAGAGTMIRPGDGPGPAGGTPEASGPPPSPDSPEAP